MKYAVDSGLMKEIDDYSVQVCGIPALELMERAAEEMVAVMKKRIAKTDRILAVCGPGNNGGDGAAAGRILYSQGYHAAILFIGEENKLSASMKAQLEKAGNLGVPIENSNKLREYNIIIDAIFGVGLARDVSGVYEAVIQEINQAENIVFAADMPSGISADSGKIMKTAVRADYTVTFGHMKQGLLLYPGADYAGEVTVADIGFPEEATAKACPDAFYYGKEDLGLLPARRNYSNKGTYGKVLIIAGSRGMSGAAFLSAKAAYRTGAGLVKVVTSEANRIIIQTSLPEALFSCYDEEGLTFDERQQKLLSDLRWASMVIAGPGLGQSETAQELVETVVRRAEIPVILDADAINILANRIEGATMEERLNSLASLLRERTILTPHLMELSRLTGSPVSRLADNLIDTARQCSYNNKLIYAIKDARSIVAQQGRNYINVSGNNGMATGGSGDVLTGIIGALIAQGMEAYEAACLGVYIHGLAGDAAAMEKGPWSTMASDIVNSIENVINTRGKA
jgi:NAD(P)H-hydrate epimerase